MIRRIACITLLILMLSIPVSAKESYEDEFLKEQYKNSGADDLENYLPEDTREFMKENGLVPEANEILDNITAENVFSHIWGFLKGGIKAPVACGGAVLAVILISAVISSSSNDVTAQSCNYASVICAAAVIIVPVYSVIKSGVDAMQSSSVFMTAFIPVFAIVTAASGGVTSGTAMSALLLTASQAVSFIANFIVLPLMSGYLGISIASSVSPVVFKTGIADGIKKIAFWTMSLTSTVFIGILSIQTAVTSATDTLTTKTAKFVIGSAVPVAGTALSEALTTVTASMGILKTGIGLYGVIACALIFLPLIVEMLLWRLMLNITSAVSDLFSGSGISAILRSVDTVLSVLIGIILLIGAVFIISLTVVVNVTK